MPLLMDKENVAPKGTKAVEEIYQKKTQLEHILLRPDTYIGSVEKETDTLWVCDKESQLVQRSVTYVPGLYKIFDEILVNAADNKQRDSSMDTLRVDIDVENNSISVYNNGQGIPVEMHKEHNVYVPELIFGHLLTSSNYDDSQKKTVGGRNGYGAKLANIFSKEFIVESQDRKRGMSYYQKFTDNMSVKGKPIIKQCDKVDYTRVTFKPDFAKFGMRGLDDDIIALIRKRVHDVAGTAGKGLKVFLDGKKIAINSFKDYVDLYLNPGKETTGSSTPKYIHEVVNARWEVAVAISDGHFQQVSFVNSICTTKGGKHVLCIADQLTKKVVEWFGKKHKKLAIKPQFVKNQLWVFVNSLIENPAFDSQTKGSLTTNKSSFGSSCDLSETFIKKLLKSSIVESMVEALQSKSAEGLAKTDGKKNKGRLTGIEKLDEANWAGGKKAQECTLILTEGDSAKSLAVSGLSVVGRDKYGVFPLKGKLMNVREASDAQIVANAEIKALKTILGLKQNTKSSKELRYGHVMLMTDQDQDGSHIKGLVINLFMHFWPELLREPGFLLEFITPIVKVKRAKQQVCFYSLPEYKAWKESHNNGKGWTIKYYKGLGTSDANEAKQYFQDLRSHRKVFDVADAEDCALVDMAFNKKKADERKVWIEACEPGTYLDQSVEKIKYSDFINKELVLFSMASNVRAIPSMVDGLKPGQRKILWSCFKRHLTKEIKVAQLAGYVSEHSAYHHGEASLTSTIVGLAQNYVGSNNINLLMPNGQFGTRDQGGKNAASARYIFTALNPIARLVFPESDDSLLKQLNEDGQMIEPEWYCPILPMALVNGAAGIGTGWSTTIPNFNPRDIITNLRALLDGQPLQQMHPWYQNFTGSIQLVEEGNLAKGYLIEGTVLRTDESSFAIVELPIGEWTQDYKKEFLDPLVASGQVKGYNEYHTDNTVSFLVQMPSEEAANRVEREGAMHFFKLTTSFKLANMVLFDRFGKLKKYKNVEEILREFYDVRLELYHLRKAHLVDKLSVEVRKLENKVRFITAVVADKLNIKNVPKKKLLAELHAQKYDKFLKKKMVVHEGEEEVEVGEGGEGAEEEQDTMDVAGYDYLLSMSLWTLTAEKVLALKKERDGKLRELDLLNATTPTQMWQYDLDALLAGLEQHENTVRGSFDDPKAKKKTTLKGRPVAVVHKPVVERKKKIKDIGSGDEDDDAKAEKAAKRKAGGARKVKKEPEDDDDYEKENQQEKKVRKTKVKKEEDDEEDNVKVKVKKEKKVKEEKEEKIKVKKEKEEVKQEVKEDRELSFEERILLKMQQAEKMKAGNDARVKEEEGQEKSRKRLVKKEESDNDDDDDFEAATTRSVKDEEEDGEEKVEEVHSKPKREKRQVKPKYVDSDDELLLSEDEQEEEEEEEEEVSDAVADLDDEDASDDDFEPEKPSKSKAKKAEKSKPTKAKRATKEVDSDSGKGKKKGTAVKSSNSGVNVTGKRMPSSVQSSAHSSAHNSSVESDDDDFKPKKKKVAAKPKAIKEKSEKATKPKKEAAKPKRAKKRDDDDDSFDEDSDVDRHTAPTTTEARPARARKPIKYMESDNDVELLSEDD